MKNKIGFYILIIFITFILSKSFSQQNLTPEQIYEKVSNAVVIVLSYDTNGNLKSQGSGVYINETGYIITNYHVFADYSKVKIMHGKDIVDNVEIIGFNKEKDVLALKISDAHFSGIPIAELNELKVGQRVYAIGSPMGYENTISEGIISGFRSYNGLQLIQITASISHGSSGGAVVNSKGELVGISTYTVSEGQSINFALPISDVLNAQLTPYKNSKNKNLVETPTIQKHSAKDDFTFWEDKAYNKKAVELLVKAKKNIDEANSLARLFDRSKNKKAISYLTKAVGNLNEAIKLDSNLIEAYYLGGYIYSDITIWVINEEETKKYYDRLINLIHDKDGILFDSLSVRQIIGKVALDFEGFNKDVISGKKRAIELYELALTKQLTGKSPLYYGQYDETDILTRIVRSYEGLADLIKSSNYFESLDYYTQALAYSKKLTRIGPTYIWLEESIIKEMAIAKILYISSGWVLFKDIYSDNALTNNNYLYLYHTNSIIKDKVGIIRVWVKEVSLKEANDRASDEYEYSKSLYEFDVKNNKIRLIQQSIQYNRNDQATNDNYPNAEWQFISPETIAEKMVKYLQKGIK
ncbi:MAG: hypothetical protein AUJ54_09630 [Ignavibacteria bacterium CG1_02_37_35]|nr:MAG: hypothetical protein AUJ54_09630 [Ignavibacteria bacterium CG1_02_37_35]